MSWIVASWGQSETFFVLFFNSLVSSAVHFGNVYYVAYQTFHDPLNLALATSCVFCSSMWFATDLYNEYRERNVMSKVYWPFRVRWLGFREASGFFWYFGQPLVMNDGFVLSWAIHDDPCKVAWYVAIWAILIACQLATFVVAFFWWFFYRFFFLSFWFLLGAFLFHCKALSVVWVRRMWYDVWTLHECDWDENTPGFKVDGRMFNESWLVGFIFETVIMFLVQAFNGYRIERFTSSAKTSLVICMVAIALGLYKIVVMWFYPGYKVPSHANAVFALDSPLFFLDIIEAYPPMKGTTTDRLRRIHHVVLQENAGDIKDEDPVCVGKPRKGAGGIFDFKDPENPKIFDRYLISKGKKQPNIAVPPVNYQRAHEISDITIEYGYNPASSPKTAAELPYFYKLDLEGVHILMHMLLSPNFQNDGPAKTALKGELQVLQIRNANDLERYLLRAQLLPMNLQVKAIFRITQHLGKKNRIEFVAFYKQHRRYVKQMMISSIVADVIASGASGAEELKRKVLKIKVNNSAELYQYLAKRHELLLRVCTFYDAENDLSFAALVETALNERSRLRSLGKNRDGDTFGRNYHQYQAALAKWKRVPKASEIIDDAYSLLELVMEPGQDIFEYFSSTEWKPDREVEFFRENESSTLRGRLSKRNGYPFTTDLLGYGDYEYILASLAMVIDPADFARRRQQFYEEHTLKDVNRFALAGFIAESREADLTTLSDKERTKADKLGEILWEIGIAAAPIQEENTKSSAMRWLTGCLVTTLGCFGLRSPEPEQLGLKALVYDFLMEQGTQTEAMLGYTVASLVVQDIHNQISEAEAEAKTAAKAAARAVAKATLKVAKKQGLESPSLAPIPVPKPSVTIVPQAGVAAVVWRLGFSPVMEPNEMQQTLFKLLLKGSSTTGASGTSLRDEFVSHLDDYETRSYEFRSQFRKTLIGCITDYGARNRRFKAEFEARHGSIEGLTGFAVQDMDDEEDEQEEEEEKEEESGYDVEGEIRDSFLGMSLFRDSLSGAEGAQASGVSDAGPPIGCASLFKRHDQVFFRITVDELSFTSPQSAYKVRFIFEKAISNSSNIVPDSSVADMSKEKPVRQDAAVASPDVELFVRSNMVRRGREGCDYREKIAVVKVVQLRRDRTLQGIGKLC